MTPAILDPRESALTIGALSEEAVERVLVPSLLPWWFLRARRATTAEDEIAKFDFAVYTRDVGRILLQVKSSRCGAEKHENRQRYGRPLYRIHVVIARPEMATEVVLGRVLAACVIAREEAFAGRCTADHVKLCRAIPAREAA
jgi:hypothetical protein